MSATGSARPTSEPPRLFSWDTYLVTDKGVTFGASGATTDRRRAIRALGDTLRAAPVGTSGVIWKVELDSLGTAKYEYGGIIARAQHAPSGCVNWSKGALHGLDLSCRMEVD